MNQPWVYMCSSSWTPLPLPSPSHYPSGLSQCTGFECPISCIKLELMIYFTYDNTRFNVILSNHPTLAFFHSPKVCSLYLCLFSCLAYKVIITISLNSIYIYVIILYCCFSFWLTSLCIIDSSFIHLIRTDPNAFFLIAELYSVFYYLFTFLKISQV